MIHPDLEKIRYPAPNEELTEQFKAYVYYALMEESDVPNLQMVVGNSASFNEFLEYAKHYQLWNFNWATLVDTYMRVKIAREMGDYADGRGPCKFKRFDKSSYFLVNRTVLFKSDLSHHHEK